jgi:hypothetical protein
MPLALRVIVLRLAIYAILGLGQVYLCVRLRQAVRGSRWSRGLKAWTIGPASLCMGVVYAVNLSIVLWHLPWVDPPVVAQVGFLYAVAIWDFGAAFSAILLVLRGDFISNSMSFFAGCAEELALFGGSNVRLYLFRRTDRTAGRSYRGLPPSVRTVSACE